MIFQQSRGIIYLYFLTVLAVPDFNTGFCPVPVPSRTAMYNKKTAGGYRGRTDDTIGERVREKRRSAC